MYANLRKFIHVAMCPNLPQSRVYGVPTIEVLSYFLLRIFLPVLTHNILDQ
jgi:hypothetical protein